MLTCAYSDEDHEYYPGQYAYWIPEDFVKFQATRRKRCCSCKVLIDQETDCLQFDRFRYPSSDIEERMYGNEVPLASWFMCESCGEIYLNLQDLGYCLDIEEDMRDLLKEYHQLTGFKKGKEDNQCG